MLIVLLCCSLQCAQCTADLSVFATQQHNSIVVCFISSCVVNVSPNIVQFMHSCFESMKNILSLSKNVHILFSEWHFKHILMSFVLFIWRKCILQGFILVKTYRATMLLSVLYVITCFLVLLVTCFLFLLLIFLFLLLSFPLTLRICPFCFQARSRRRRLNLGCIICLGLFSVAVFLF